MIRKILLNLFGALFVLSGGVWMGQGAGFLPGKLMRGDPQWILWGALMAALGAGLLWLARRRPAG
jgi:hypothetical protein